jgi:hypothetical protein
MKVIKFSKDYTKLENYDFTTIRNKNKNLKLEEIVLIKTPTVEFKAEVTGSCKIPLKDMSCDLIAKDLDSLEQWLNGSLLYEDLLKSLQVFYPELTWKSIVFGYSFMRIDEED